MSKTNNKRLAATAIMVTWGLVLGSTIWAIATRNQGAAGAVEKLQATDIQIEAKFTDHESRIRGLEKDRIKIAEMGSDVRWIKTHLEQTPRNP